MNTPLTQDIFTPKIVSYFATSSVQFHCLPFTVYISLMTEVRSPKQTRISFPFKYLVRDDLKH